MMMKFYFPRTNRRATILGLILLMLLALYFYLPKYPSDHAFANSDKEFVSGYLHVIPLVDGLENPWSMAFLPDGRVLVTERPGRLRIIHDQLMLSEPVSGLPDIVAKGQGGLLDVALHPDFEQNNWVYLSYVSGEGGKIGTEVGRGRLLNNRLVDWQTLFKLEPKSSTRRHFGSRILFDNNSYLYITLGDRGERFRAQDLSDHAGTIVRLHDDGSIPADNPFSGLAHVNPEIYSYGHRNIQGAAFNQQTSELWIHEHGPQGGDEINIAESGKNYGWPVITFGKEYGSGAEIGEGTHKTGMVQPVYYWVPSIAPSGMVFYNGEKYQDWKGSLLVGSLKFQFLARLELDGNSIVREERLLEGKLGRIRDVRVGSDGYIYLLTDARNGQLVRIEPID